MFVKQLSIFVENKPGRLSAILEELAKNQIDICALSLADTTDFGVLRMIVAKPEKAQEILRSIGVISKTSEVLAVALPDTPGSLAKILGLLCENGISVEYMYAFVGKAENRAMVVIKTDDLETAKKTLLASGVEVVEAESIYRNF